MLSELINVCLWRGEELQTLLSNHCKADVLHTLSTALHLLQKCWQ